MTTLPSDTLTVAYQDLVANSNPGENIKVGISNEVVTLLSQQLYQSPLKAVEELVVNSYDANATICKLYVPGVHAQKADPNTLMVIFDNGTGLSVDGMKNLWHVGRSNKRSEEIAKLAGRKQIGKFGIGKLAVFVISNRLSYVSKTGGQILFSSLDFRAFSQDTNGGVKPVQIELRVIKALDDIEKCDWFKKVVEESQITTEDLASENWTLAILEDFKSKAADIKLGRLSWVLRTAMPLNAGFKLFLNGSEIKSSKEDIPIVARFKVCEIGKDRLKHLATSTGEEWTVNGEAVYCDSFQSGIRGEVLITEKTLPGKSDDILRSNGFFIRVLGRLIAQEEPFFGMNPLYHGVLNRLRADIEADDLDAIIKAPREEVEASDLREVFEAFLREVFQEARQKWESHLKNKDGEEERKKELERSFVSPELIERPIAGAILRSGSFSGADADKSWFYCRGH